MNNRDHWLVMTMLLTIISLSGLSLSTLAYLSDYKKYTKCVDKGVSIPVCKVLFNIPTETN